MHYDCLKCNLAVYGIVIYLVPEGEDYLSFKNLDPIILPLLFNKICSTKTNNIIQNSQILGTFSLSMISFQAAKLQGKVKHIFPDDNL